MSVSFLQSVENLKIAEPMSVINKEAVEIVSTAYEADLFGYFYSLSFL